MTNHDNRPDHLRLYEGHLPRLTAQDHHGVHPVGISLQVLGLAPHQSPDDQRTALTLSDYRQTHLHAVMDVETTRGLRDQLNVVIPEPVRPEPTEDQQLRDQFDHSLRQWFSCYLEGLITKSELMDSIAEDVHNTITYHPHIWK